MKKSAKLKFLSLATLVFAGVFGGAAGTVAWFTTNVHIEEANMLLTGDALGAYFEYGDGTDEKPYGIKTVRQLYNLSWLQYLGYFNPTKEEGYPYSGRWTEAMKKIYGNDFSQKPHFELAGDIDFSNKDASSIGINGMPPIGTTAFPFEGFFDGRGYTISHGVFSTSTGDFGVKPLAVTTYNPDTNVGVFGKVTGAETSIKDLGISSPLVKSTLADTVIGAAIGDAGTASISNIAVDDPTLNIGNGTTTASAPISDYGLVGKTSSSLRVKQTDHSAYKLDVKQETFTAQDQGELAQWGGSIDMQSLHTRLADIMVNYAVRDNNQPAATTEYYDLNGDEITAKRNVSKKLAYSFTKNGSRIYGQIRKYNTEGVASGKTYDPKIGSYQIGTWNNPRNNQNGDPDTWLISLSGGHWAEKHYQSPMEVSTFKIHDGNGNYLGLSGTTIQNVTNAASAPEWFTIGENLTSCNIATLIDNNLHYLKTSQNGLILTTTQPGGSDSSAIWNVAVASEGNTYRVTGITQGGVALRLAPNKVWDVQENGYVIYTGSRYIGVSGRNEDATLQASVNNAAVFQTDGSNRPTTISGSYTLYLTYKGASLFDWDTHYCYAQTSNSDAYAFEEYGGNIYLKRGSNTYLRISSNSFSSGTGRTSAATFQLIYTTIGVGTTLTSKSIGYYDSSKTTSRMSYSGVDASYVPLNVPMENGIDDGDKQAIQKYQARFNNTGYIVGGNYFSSASDGYNQGTVRIAEYAQDGNIGDCLSSTTVDKDKTIDTVYTVKKEDDAYTADTIDESDEESLKKYSKAKTKLTEVLAGSDKVYGLHFTQAQISKKNLVEADYARINGIEYGPKANENKAPYQMPANSIDFNLKQKGFINFFAGSYISDGTVDSFFSLHRIIRSGNNIENIEEIEEIYGSSVETNSYAYKVVDTTDPSGTTYRYTKPYRINATGDKFEIAKGPGGKDVQYSEDYLTASEFASQFPQYSLIFDVSVIKKNDAISENEDKLFYFEIPTNEGEYCLGSDSDGEIGGYLLYLDIGANAQKKNRTEVHEKFVDYTSELVFPKGVVLVQSSTTTMAALYRNAGTDAYGNPGREKYGSDLSELDSISLRIKAGEAGAIEIERQATKVVLSRDGPPIDLRYAPLALPVYDGEAAENPLQLVREDATTITTNRLTYFEVDANTGSQTVTKIVDVTGQSRSITQTKDNKTVASPIIFKGLSYGQAAGQVFTASELSSLDIVGTYAPSSTVMEYSFQTATDNTVTLSAYDLIPILNTDTGFYAFGGYTYTMTKSGNAFQVYVTELKNGTGAIVVTMEGNPVSYTFTYSINGNTLAIGPNTVFA